MRGSRRAAALWLGALMIAGLGGCALPRPPQAPPDGPRLSGRLVVQIEGGQGGNSSFELVGDARQGWLSLSTPLGSLLARARWSPGEVWLDTPQEQRRYESLDALSQQLLGEAVPVAALFDWLRGRPWPEAPSSAGQEGRFEQLGWQIDLSRHAEGLLLARREGPPAVILRARLDP